MIKLGTSRRAVRDDTRAGRDRPAPRRMGTAAPGPVTCHEIPHLDGGTAGPGRPARRTAATRPHGAEAARAVRHGRRRPVRVMKVAGGTRICRVI